MAGKLEINTSPDQIGRRIARMEDVAAKNQRDGTATTRMTAPRAHLEHGTSRHHHLLRCALSE
jgi:hypothetical protein